MIVKKASQVKPKGIMFFNDLLQRTLMKLKGQVSDRIKAIERGKDAFFVLDRLIIKDNPPDVNISHSCNEGNAAEAVVSDNEITFKD